jgi:hypothetical protein
MASSAHLRSADRYGTTLLLASSSAHDFVILGRRGLAGMQDNFPTNPLFAFMRQPEEYVRVDHRMYLAGETASRPPHGER